jgi:GT2 family glycosyltransferase
LEILVIDNDSAEPETLDYLDSFGGRPEVRVLPFAGVFNWAAIGNFGAREANGDVLLFVNNDVLVLTQDWCRELVAAALRPEVGAVGARLLYADGRIQHAGVLVGMHGVAGHDSIGECGDSGGYLGRIHLQRQSTAVTGACLATRRVVFEEVGGFDELNLKVSFSDVDYCLKVRQAGYRVVYNPFAVLYHFESRSRGPNISEQQQAQEAAEAAAIRGRWGELVEADPFFNPHFERFSWTAFERLRPPSE